MNQKPRKPHYKDPDYVSPIQITYQRLLRTLTYIKYNKPERSKEQEIEAAYLINKIETYGFEFFPNHYVYDDVMKLNKLTQQMQRD